MRSVRELHRVPAGPVDLASYPTDEHPGVRNKRTALEQLAASRLAIADLQERYYAEGLGEGSRRRLVVVLQGMDCSGKDGTIKHVVGAMNPEGVSITSFKRPTAEELAHDFLWRIEARLPRPGYVGVFNRSHYEDVTVVRVHDLVPPEVWRQRYDVINDWEHQQAEAGVVWVKIFLHLSAREQRERLLARLDDPTKHWKFEPADLDERARWADYQQAYEVLLQRCSTDGAPWYLVPADRKWYRNWAVAGLLRETLAELNPRWPRPDLDVAALRARLDG